MATAQKDLLDQGPPAWMQALPLAIIFLLFFIVPLLLTVAVSVWNYDEYQIIPDITSRNYVEAFEGCLTELPSLCTTLKTYVTTLRISVTVWAITLVLGFAVAYFLAFHVRSSAPSRSSPPTSSA